MDRWYDQFEYIDKSADGEDILQPQPRNKSQQAQIKTAGLHPRANSVIQQAASFNSTTTNTTSESTSSFTVADLKYLSQRNRKIQSQIQTLEGGSGIYGEDTLYHLTNISDDKLAPLDEQGRRRVRFVDFSKNTDMDLVFGKQTYADLEVPVIIQPNSPIETCTATIREERRVPKNPPEKFRLLEEKQRIRAEEGVTAYAEKSVYQIFVSSEVEDPKNPSVDVFCEREIHGLIEGPLPLHFSQTPPVVRKPVNRTRSLRTTKRKLPVRQMSTSSSSSTGSDTRKHVGFFVYVLSIFECLI